MFIMYYRCLGLGLPSKSQCVVGFMEPASAATFCLQGLQESMLKQQHAIKKNVSHIQTPGFQIKTSAKNFMRTFTPKTNRRAVLPPVLIVASLSSRRQNVFGGL